MANTTKKFVIEIQLDSAKQNLDEATKKIATLDAQLEGLDRNSDAAKAIVAEMAKLAEQAEAAESKISSLTDRLDDIKPGTMAALRAEIEEMEGSFEHLVIGTKEYDDALLALARKRGELKPLEDALDALAPTERAAAFVDMANGLAGAVGVITVAGQALGLSADTAAEYEQKMQTAVAVTSSFEAISKALSAESRANISNLLSTAKAYLAGGEAATTGGKAARLAIAGTGIGLLVLAVGVLVSQWDRLTASVKGSEAFFTKVKAITSGLFDSAIASLKLFLQLNKDFFTGDLAGLAQHAKNAGKTLGDAYDKGYQESLRESHRKTLEGQIAAQDRLIEVLKARGVQTYQLEEANLAAKLALQKRGTEDEKKAYLDLQKDLDVLRATQAQRERADAQALTQARLSGVLAIEQAAGRESFAAQLALEKDKLAALKAATDPQLAAIEAQENAITALQVAKAREREEKRRALADATLQAQLVKRRAQGGDEYQLALDLNKLQEQAAAKHLENLRNAAQVDAAAVQAADAELFRIQREGDDIRRAEELKQEAAHQQSLATELEGYQVRVLIKEKKHQADLLLAQQAAQDIAAQIAERARIAAIPPLSLEDNFLIRVFGLHPLQLEKTKQALASAQQNVGALVGTLLSEGLAAADVAIQDAQTRLSALDQQLSESRSAAQATEEQLAESSGAKRDYLLLRLAKERAEVERLASAKKKAADDEKRAAAEREKIEKRQQQLIAATTLATNVGTAAEAVAAGVKAISAGSSIPFPGNIAAVVAGIAAVASAVISAKAFANSFADGTGALGSDGVLQGPRHTGGGIGLFNRYGHFYGEAEGGEAITPVDATARNARALELIRTQGRTRTLTPLDFAHAFTVPFEIAPPPAGYYPGHYATGGTLPAGSGGLAGGSASAADLSARMGSLEAQTARTNELLEQVVRHTARAADSNDFLADRPPIVPDYETAMAYDRKLQEIRAAENSARL
jgi:hypothetical protein